MQNDLNSNNKTGKPIIALSKVGKIYPVGQFHALKDISLSVEEHEFVAIIGPSGCGKSTLLKIITGLEKQTSGTVEVPPTISMVFQSGALLPWRTVEGNVLLGLEEQQVPEKDRERIAKEFLSMVGLSDMVSKYPRELSGGQRQRVGLARALAVKPSVLLLDEPFSALDPKTTEELHKDVLAIWKEQKLTIVMVSHLIEEAVSLADRVVLMKEGKIEEIFPVSLPYPRREQALAFHILVQRIRAKFFA